VGAQTQRAVQNFPVSGERIGRDLITGLAWVKGAAAVVYGMLGVLDADMAAAIAGAAAEVAHEALRTGRSIRDAVISRGYVSRGDITQEQLDQALDVLRMTRPQ
jgi:fumarate hydratase class II